MSTMQTLYGTILRPGTFTTSEGNELVVDDEMLASIADNYSAEVFRAPLVRGHPEEETGAMGYVSRLKVNEDGHLEAEIEANGQLVWSLEDKTLLAHSVSLYPPDAPGNPQPDTWGLQHLGFLGSTPPAVKGLVPFMKEKPRFGETSGAKSFKLSEPASFEERSVGGETEEKLREENKNLAARLAEIEKDLAAEKRKRLADKTRAESVAFAEQLEREGRIPSAQTEGVADLMERAAALDGGAAGSEEGDFSAALRALLEQLPSNSAKPSEADQFSEPPAGGSDTEPTPKQIREFAEKNEVSVTEASRQLRSQGEKQ